MSATKAYSDEGHHSPDRYSDDFVSDDDKKTQQEKRLSKKASGHQYYQDKFHMQRKGSGSVRGQVQGRRLRKVRGNSGVSEPDMKKHNESITTRVLSASRNRINELRNKIEEQQIKIRDLEQENKLYKTVQFRQEKTIRTFSDKENDLPMILDKHNNEIRALKEQNRRLREKYEKSDRYLRDAEDELEKVKKKMSKYKDICDDKELMERDELTRRLTKVEQEMEEKEAKIKELQKHIEVLRKSHRHEMGIETARQKDVKKQLEVLKEKNVQLESLIKEKEKALDYQNIHSNLRQGRSSRNNSPDSSLAKKSKKKAASTTELTPRDKAKYSSEKQRADKQKELKEEQERKKRQKLKEEMEDVLPKNPSEFLFSSTNWTHEETDKSTRQDKEEKELQKRREQQNVDSIARIDEEKKDKDENEKREQWEMQELNSRKRKEIEEYERKENEKRDVREKLKLDIKEKKDEGTQLQKENYLILQADRKNKDDLLKKLKMVDEMGGAAATDPFLQSSPIKKNKEQTREVAENNEYSSTRPINSLHHSKPSSKDAANPHLEHQTNKRQTSGDNTGGYQPSFGPTRGNMNKPNTKPTSAFDDDEPIFKLTNDTASNTMVLHDKKKPNLLESLFGPQANSSKIVSTNNVEENETFLITNKVPPSNIRTKAVSNGEIKSGSFKTNNSTFYSDKKSTIFGGDNSLIDNDLIDKASSHRQRQQNPKMFSSKPSGTLVDNFDDEIEEVIL